MKIIRRNLGYIAGAILLISAVAYRMSESGAKRANPPFDAHGDLMESRKSHSTSSIDDVQNHGLASGDNRSKRHRRDSKDVVASKPLIGPRYAVFDDEGVINQEIMKLAGIAPERKLELDIAIKKVLGEISRNMQSKARLLKNETNENRVTKTYEVPGTAEYGANNLRELRSVLEANFGRGAANVLIPYLSGPEILGGLGGYTIQMDLNSNRMQTGIYGNVTFRILNPETGEIASEGMFGERRKFQQNFGELLADETGDDYWNSVSQ
jgi:hypothetical protein